MYIVHVGIESLADNTLTQGASDTEAYSHYLMDKGRPDRF